MGAVHEPARDVPVAWEGDVVVLGGSATGVFAAVAAAREGARTAIVERNGFFGGMATAAIVSVWHKLTDIAGERQIIAGLTAEVVERLKGRGAVGWHGDGYTLNTEEMKIELDRLVVDAGVRPFLHAFYVSAATSDGKPTAAIVEDKSGRRAIRAGFFIDATGDGDFIRDVGLPFEMRDDVQPPTMCARFEGLRRLEASGKARSLADVVVDPEIPGHLPPGFIWWADTPGLIDDRMVAGTRVSGADCSDADELTRAEIEGRRQVRTIHDIVREHLPGGENIALSALPATIGIRETRHACCLHRLTEAEVLEGVRFDDAIGNGTYQVDVHHSDKPGLTFRYLDGTEVYAVPGRPSERGRWREEREHDPAFYQIPYRCLVPRGARNVLVAGRLIDADRGAYGAIRVMVNCNQTGEAAGAACALALQNGWDVDAVDARLLRSTLAKRGVAVI